MRPFLSLVGLTYAYVIAMIGVFYVNRLFWHYTSICGDLPLFTHLAGWIFLAVYLGAGVVIVGYRLWNDAWTVRLAAAAVLLTFAMFIEIAFTSYGISFPCMPSSPF